MQVSQCSKEDGRSSSGPAHEPAAPKRTYDMMEGRVGRALASAGIEGGHLPAHRLPPCGPLHSPSALGPQRPLEGGSGMVGSSGDGGHWLAGSCAAFTHDGRWSCPQLSHNAVLSCQVSWAVPSHPSTTARTTSKSSTTCAAPSRKVPPPALLAGDPGWEAQCSSVGGKGGRCDAERW